MSTKNRKIKEIERKNPKAAPWLRTPEPPIA